MSAPCTWRVDRLTELTAGRELDDGATSFKTSAFPQKKERLEVMIEAEMKEEEDEEEEAEGGRTVGWCAAAVV